MSATFKDFSLLASLADDDEMVGYDKSSDTEFRITVANLKTLLAAGLKSVQVFTASGTWTKPAGVTKVRVQLVGGGGGSGSDSTNSNQTGGGGAAAGYTEGLIDVSATSSVAVTIGAGGAGGAVGGNGSPGGTSSFGTFLSGTGGDGGKGAYTDSTYIAGGSGSGGNINISGSPGGGNKSGNSILGFNNGKKEDQTAAGAGGTAGSNGNSSIPGYAGGPGIVIVWEYA